MHDSGDTAHWTLNYLDLTIEGHPKVKDHEVNCMTYHVFHIDDCHNMHHSEDTAQYKINLA